MVRMRRGKETRGITAGGRKRKRVFKRDRQRASVLLLLFFDGYSQRRGKPDKEAKIQPKEAKIQPKET